MGKITLYFGCMFSGKTSILIRECRKCMAIGKKVLCINYAQDNRYSDEEYIMSHNLDKVDCIKVNTLSDVSDDTILNHDYIMVDEGQFFTDLKEYVIKWCEQYNKSITVISLDGDFQRNLFGSISELIPYCDTINKLTALCRLCSDGTEALFTCRISNENEQVVIGVNNYMPLCRKHFLEHNKESNSKENNSKESNSKESN